VVSGISPVGITQNELFLNCDTVLLEVRYIAHRVLSPVICVTLTCRVIVSVKHRGVYKKLS
jgi:hypothetical protein